MADDKDEIKEENEKQVEEVNDLRMSRTEKPEYEIDFSKIRDCIVYDATGNKIRFGEIFKNQKTIIFFVRHSFRHIGFHNKTQKHFIDFIAKDYVEDLATIPLEYLQEANVRLVVIGPAPYKFISDFKKETGYQYTLYCDPDREVYQKLGLKYKVESVSFNASRHIKQNVLMGMIRSTWKIMRIQEWEGDIKQQGGAFIFGPGEEMHYFHVDNNSVDHAPINEVLQAAGVQPVSFPRDPRVQEV